ncbi:MAG: hypothetical protein B6I26_01185 [Desulfobacteraceae bacterium 4572_130]|nr:MAG: hypothetical protein B6I26_01185 [Desulfobacteraceae bacterium 4572_130]
MTQEIKLNKLLDSIKITSTNPDLFENILKQAKTTKQISHFYDKFFLNLFFFKPIIIQAFSIIIITISGFFFSYTNPDLLYDKTQDIVEISEIIWSYDLENKL